MHQQRNSTAFLVACSGIATFAGMDVFMKELSIALGAYNALLWRTLIALAIMLPLFLSQRRAWPQGAALRIHLRRGLVTAVMAFLFFWGLARVPLAEAVALSFIAPLIALYLAATILKETITRQAVLASFIGLAGALIVIGGKLSGSYGEDVVAGIAAILLSAVLYAYNLILQRQQALLAHPVEIALFQNGTLVTLYLCLAPIYAVAPQPGAWPGLAAAAVLGISSILLLSWAYARAEAKVLLPVEYTAFIWAALFGWLFFAEALTLSTVAGTVLIVSGCLLAARQYPRNAAEHGAADQA